MQVNFSESKRHALLNTIHTWLLVAGSIVLLAVCAWVFMGFQGVFYAVIFGGISLLVGSRISPELVLRMYKAEQVSNAQFPVGHEILDQLVERAELEVRPSLYIIPSQIMNAFAVGRSDQSAIAMTDQLVRNLTRRELAGVMAHEVAHIKNEDVRVMAIADMVSRFTSTLSTFGFLGLIFNFPSLLFGTATNFPWLGVLVLLAAPTVGGLLQMALSRAREFDADLGAALFTGDPDGLALALLKLEKIQKAKWEGMVLPGSRMPEPSMLRTHPKTEDRVARLMSLKGEIENSLQPTYTQQKKTGSIPMTTNNWGRKEQEKYARYATMMAAENFQSVYLGEDGEKPGSDHTINPADRRPRIRISRGGVWW